MASGLYIKDINVSGFGVYGTGSTGYIGENQFFPDLIRYTYTLSNVRIEYSSGTSLLPDNSNNAVLVGTLTKKNGGSTISTTTVPLTITDVGSDYVIVIDNSLYWNKRDYAKTVIPQTSANVKGYFINGNNLVGGKVVLKDSTKKVNENSNSTTTNKKMKVNAKEGLNVRSTPGGTKVGALTYGTEVIVTEEQSGWSKIGDKKWVSSKYLSPVSSSGTTISVKVGDKVKVKQSATKYVTGETIPSWVKGRTYTVRQVSNGKILLKEIMSWFYLKDLTK